MEYRCMECAFLPRERRPQGSKLLWVGGICAKCGRTTMVMDYKGNDAVEPVPESPRSKSRKPRRRKNAE